MRERGLCVDHTTIYRWVQRYAPEIDKRCRPFLRRTNDSYRIDETYVRVAGAWTYLYRGVDSNGDALDFLLRATRDRKAAIAFFRKTLGCRSEIDAHQAALRGWKGKTLSTGVTSVR